MVAALYVTLAGAAVVFAIWAATDAVRQMRDAAEVRKVPWYRTTWLAALTKVAVIASLTAMLPLWRNFSIPAGSMIPSIQVGDHVVVRPSGSLTRVVPGDIVVFRLPRDPSIEFIKRIVGLPGDRIQMNQGQLYVNGKLCAREPDGDYVTSDGGYTLKARAFMETLPNGARYQILKMTDGTDASRRPGFDPSRDFDVNNTVEYVVPPSHLFVMGDHRDNSVDSRFMNQVGFVPLENLVGRAGIVLYSIDAGHLWYEIWRLPSDIRWNRSLRPVQ